ncbi:hypothetical protein BF28_5794 (plasmid) [Bacillus cereus E33L]|uniref:Uncharacterized protein n=1 Tax=Bacillus cereus (strain ZK / E33L) TaxID=288681 RepID=Q4V283_BACCZ|nr:hypothetical protein pE33L466_0003 [Bacillus cereus E33L]AJI26172.1 hypothetical protein BF28_5794 [Bacillus cereus E33L]
MLIYTVMMYFHADTDIMLATLDKEQALKEFKSDSMYWPNTSVAEFRDKVAYFVTKMNVYVT